MVHQRKSRDVTAKRRIDASGEQMSTGTASKTLFCSLIKTILKLNISFGPLRLHHDTELQSQSHAIEKFIYSYRLA